MVTGCGVDGMGSNRAPDFTNPYHGAGIYANMWGILMGSMLPYIAAPWIRWGLMMINVDY